MSEDVDHRDLHQRAQPHRRPHVVAEDEEARSVRPHLAVREPVEDRAHRVLAHSEVQVAAGSAARREISGVFEGEPRLGRRRQVGGAPEQPRHVPGDGVQHLARRLAPGDPLPVDREVGYVAIPTVR